MKKGYVRFGAIAIIIVLSFVFACQNPINVSEPAVPQADSLAGEEVDDSLLLNPDIITDIGKVTYIDLEGGFWGIIGSKGKYDPVNLPGEFCVEGLLVIFRAELIKDAASIHMWGQLIRIIKIEKLEQKLITDVGVVRQVGIQGNPFIIEGKKGTYQPLNLPDRFKVPGLKVKFLARLRPDIIIIPNLWPIIEILKIEAVSQPVYFELGQRFKLPVTETAIEKTENIQLVFERVLTDSRCPQDVVCIWAGEAVVSVNITIGLRNYGSFKLSTLTDSNSVVVNNFRFTFLDLSPYPVSTSDISPLRYVGIFLVERVADVPVEITLGEKFKLPVTKTAVEKKAKIEFVFDEVLSDSRCPTGAQCFWAGEAIVAVNITIRGVDYGKFKLSTQPGYERIIVDRYSFTFLDLYPYPSLLDTALTKDYTGIFLIDYVPVITVDESVK
ncbi:MAG: hypothetical protein JW881_00685 [Spirochaetales bacterium]|nr:hypothetical protein [Spirochaetales bacterium]